MKKNKKYPPWHVNNIPKDRVILLDIDLPWLVYGIWNEYEKQFVYANMQVNMVDGEFNDSYFENEYAELEEIKGWCDIPETCIHDV